MHSLHALAALVLTAPAIGQIALAPAGQIDVVPLDLTALGGAAYDSSSGHLWLTDAGLNNEVFEIDPLTGSILTQFDASVIPGVTSGPDAMAIDPTSGNIAIFSAFRGGTGEGLVTQGGQLVSAWGATVLASSATYTQTGELWAYSYPLQALVELDPQTGAIVTQYPMQVLTGLAWDPLTGHLFGLTTVSLELIEIDPANGAQLSVTGVAAFGLPLGFPAGMTFDATGSRLFVAKGFDSDVDHILIFDRLAPIGASYCSPAVPNSTGQPARIGAYGGAVAGGNPFVLRMDDLPPNQFGFFSCGRVQGFTQGLGGSQGNFCLSLPFGRFAAQLASSGAHGTIQINVNTLALPLSPPIAALAGETWNFQGWYRDVNPTSTSNFSDGLAVTFL